MLHIETWWSEGRYHSGEKVVNSSQWSNTWKTTLFLNTLNKINWIHGFCVSGVLVIQFSSGFCFTLSGLRLRGPWVGSVRLLHQTKPIDLHAWRNRISTFQIIFQLLLFWLPYCYWFETVKTDTDYKPLMFKTVMAPARGHLSGHTQPPPPRSRPHRILTALTYVDHWMGVSTQPMDGWWRIPPYFNIW